MDSLAVGWGSLGRTLLWAEHRGPVKRLHPNTTLDVVATVMARVLPSIGCGGWKNCGVGLPFPAEKNKETTNHGVR